MNIEILLVEDEEADVYLLESALAYLNLPIKLSIVGDGEEVLKYIKQEGQYKGVSKPDMVLLDINLPKLTGLEVLDYLKQDRAFRVIPIIVLCSANNDTEILTSYKLQANAYIVKPTKIADYRQMVQNLVQYWFKTAKTFSMLGKPTVIPALV